jgi:type II secretory pathway pseudopilin PulG
MQRRGFTLVELLIVIIFSMILFGTVSIFGISALYIQELDRTVQTIRNELVAARDEAMSGRDGSAWGVAFGTSTAVCFKGSTYGERDTAFDLVNPFAPRMVITGPLEFVFSPPFGNAIATGTILVANGPHHASITVNNYGMIEVQN